MKIKLQAGKNSVQFLSEGKKLAGNIFVPENFKQGQKLSAIVVTTPAGGIKEQTAGIYAKKMASKGFIALVYDSRTYGESEGAPRNLEDPDMKIRDIHNAISYLGTLEEVDSKQIFGLGVCAGSGYLSAAITTDRRIKAFATVVAAFDQREIVIESMGKDVLVNVSNMIGTARQKYYETGEEVTMPAFEADATKRVSQIQKEGWEYYMTERGQHPNHAGNKFAATGTNLFFSAYDYANLVSPTPLLAIIGNRADSAPQTHRMLELIDDKENTELFVIDGASHFDLYDKDEYVNQAIDKISTFLKKYK